jgi:hypothetical protein
MEKPIIQPSATDFDALGQDKGALKLPGGDAAVQIYALRVVRLLATHNKLVVLNRNAEVFHCKTRDSESDPQGILAELFDIVWRISIAGNLAYPIERPLEMIET